MNCGPILFDGLKLQAFRCRQSLMALVMFSIVTACFSMLWHELGIYDSHLQTNWSQKQYYGNLMSYQGTHKRIYINPNTEKLES